MYAMTFIPKHERQQREMRIREQKHNRYLDELYLLISNGKIHTQYGINRSDFLKRKISMTR